MKTTRDSKEIEKVKEKILNGAVEIILQHGFQALTIRGLGKKIGMTGPNIYNYFPGKDALYLSIVIKGYETLYSNLKQVLEQQQDPLERAKLLIRTYLDFGLKYKNYYEIMFKGSLPKYDDYVGTAYEQLAHIEHQTSMRIIQLAADTLAEFATSHLKITPQRHQMYLLHIWSLLHGMITLFHSKMVYYVVENPETLYVEIIENAIALILKGELSSSRI
ncbi:TetR/AcrR family transcriptional regulator [Deltaproteobacteria bacterium TL4]